MSEIEVTEPTETTEAGYDQLSDIAKEVVTIMGTIDIAAQAMGNVGELVELNPRNFIFAYAPKKEDEAKYTLVLDDNKIAFYISFSILGECPVYVHKYNSNDAPQKISIDFNSGYIKVMAELQNSLKLLWK